MNQHREDMKSNADNLSKVVLSTFKDLSKHMLTIEKHSIEEQRLIRAKPKDIPNNLSNVDSAKSKLWISMQSVVFCDHPKKTFVV